MDWRQVAVAVFQYRDRFSSPLARVSVSFSGRVSFCGGGEGDVKGLEDWEMDFLVEI